MRPEWRPYTSEEIQYIETLLKKGIRAGIIAVRLGRSVHSIYQITCKFIKPNKARQLRQFEIAEQRRERIAKGFESGLTITELARAFETSHANICMILDRAGIDAERRREIRRGDW